MQLEERIERIIEPAIFELGFSVVRVQLSGTHNPRLQIMAEPTSDKKMTVEHCAKISRAVSALLDIDDPIQGNYTLEVSSPGLDRPLVKLADFERFIGLEVRIETKAAIDGRKKFRGRLERVEEKTIRILIDGEGWGIPYSSVRRAKLVVLDDVLAGQRFVDNASECTLDFG